MRTFWKGRRVLLTGHTGYKGTWMTLMLENLGAIVYGYSLPVKKGCFYEKVMPRVEKEWEGDIAARNMVMEVIQEVKPEIIIHLASHSSLEGSKEIPDYILRTNLMGVVNVLEATRKTKDVKTVVIVTSDKCYYNQDKDIKYTEKERLWATDPYSASKVGQEIITECYRDTFFQTDERRVGVATARASNVIGAGDDNLSRLLPYVFWCYLNEEIPQIRNPKTIRPWQYVLDVLKGYLLLTQKLYETVDKENEYCGAYNFGPNDDGFVSVEEITKLVSQCFEDKPYAIIAGEGHIKHEALVLKLDSTKAKEKLGWTPRKDLKQAIQDTVYVLKNEKQLGIGKLARELVNTYLDEEI